MDGTYVTSEILYSCEIVPDCAFRQRVWYTNNEGKPKIIVRLFIKEITERCRLDVDVSQLPQQECWNEDTGVEYIFIQYYLVLSFGMDGILRFMLEGMDGELYGEMHITYS